MRNPTVWPFEATGLGTTPRDPLAEGAKGLGGAPRPKLGGLRSDCAQLAPLFLPDSGQQGLGDPRGTWTQIGPP